MKDDWMKNNCKHEVFILDEQLGKICESCGLMFTTIYPDKLSEKVKYIGEDVVGVNISGTQSRRTPLNSIGNLDRWACNMVV